MTRISSILWLSLIATLTLPSFDVSAQQMPAVDGRQFMLNQMTPPGISAEWAAKLGRTTPEYFQPVKVSLPTTGVVTFFEGSPNRFYDQPAPAQAGLIVGRVYRLRVTNVPELPGLDFFPTIELIDRLHPPHGKIDEFPVEIDLALEELEWAANGRLITKVVYLEQPNRAPVDQLESKDRTTTIEPNRNVIAEADVLGRPIAIVRLGGRTPDPNRPEPEFFGPGGPIRISTNHSSTAARIESRRSDVVERTEPGFIRLGQKTTRRLAQR